MNDVELRTVTFGSLLEETPEGLYRMDRIRRYADALNELLDPKLIEAIDAQLDAAILGSDPLCGGCNNREGIYVRCPRHGPIMRKPRAQWSAKEHATIDEVRTQDP